MQMSVLFLKTHFNFYFAVQLSLNGSSQDEVLQNVQEEHGGSIDSSTSPLC